MQSGYAQHVIRTAARTDGEWRQKVEQDETERSRYLPWMPFPLPVFVSMLYEAVAEAPGDRFLEIGCGPGSKLLVAQELFGLDVHGIERTAAYVAAAWELGLAAEVADAAGYPRYGDPDIIWFNRPFRDPDPEYKLECQVWADMKPGAVVMCANLEYPPPSSWPLILDDLEARRGIWVKPPAR